MKTKRNPAPPRHPGPRPHWLAPLAFIALAHPAPCAPGQTFTAWQWSQPLEVRQAGLTRVELPPATLAVLQGSLADLRLLAPDGTETPWLLEMPPPPPVDVPATEFRATLEGQTTVLTATHHVGAITAVTLVSPARGFVKAARIEGSADGLTWQPLVAGEMIFRQADGAERLRIPLGPAAWPRLRVTIDDQRSPPVAFTGLVVSPAAAAADQVEHPVRLVRREETTGESRLFLNLGARNLKLAELTLDIPEGAFSRPCRLAVVLTEKDGLTAEREIARGRLYRVAGEGAAAANLKLPVHTRVAAADLVLIIANGDSPPLEVKGLRVTREPDHVVFFANQTGAWQILAGNRHAAAPGYDLEPLRAALARAPAAPLQPGPLAAKADYRAPESLPGLVPAGGGIDLRGWAFRRAVIAGSAGTIRVELDPAVLARAARDDLGDLRLVQDGKQIPWLPEPDPPLRELRPEIREEPDPERPSVSRWKLTLPFKGLPAVDLTALSPDPLFTRVFRVVIAGKDEAGNPWTRVAGSAAWTKSPTDESATPALRVPLAGARLPETFVLETDNGDNPPVRLETVAVRYHAASLVAKVGAAGPLHLYYGNHHARPPVYDLDLVRAELLAADKSTATLDSEERLQATPDDDATRTAGSPWLWAALVLVVVALLAIVAKMLPKAPSPDGA